jgi:hypothetical protein
MTSASVVPHRTRRDRLRQVWRDQCVYALHLVTLFRPGTSAPVHDADHNESGVLDSWTADQIRILIDEGRRQIDRQTEDLERVRQRAQVALVIGLALEGTVGALRGLVSSAETWPAWVLWALGLVLVAWAVLGAAATAVVQADMQIIHATVLSRRSGDVERGLAADYAAMAPVGEKQLATRLTNLRLAVAFLLAGAAATLGAWLWADASQPARTHRVASLASMNRSTTYESRHGDFAIATSPSKLALGRRDAARALGVSDETFDRYVRPTLPVVHMGSARVYPVAELKRWLREHAETPSATPDRAR